MANHDLPRDIDLAYAKAYRDASDAAHRLALAIDDSYMPDHERRSWGFVTQFHAVMRWLENAAQAVPVPPCRWCGRPAGDPACRCNSLPARREPDEDVLIDGPFTEED